MTLDMKSSHTASLRLARVASHLNQAGKQLAAARNAAPDRHSREKLFRLARDLQELSQPVARIVAAIKGGDGR